MAHEIPFNDPAVLTAAETFPAIMFTEDYVLGGALATPDIAFATPRRPCSRIRRTAGCTARPASSTRSSPRAPWPARTTTVPAAPIDQEGTLYAGELTVVGQNRPEVVDFLERFIAENVQCEMGSVTASSRISPNVGVGPDCYANEILADASVILTDALETGTGRFDASDLMPAEVGSGSFWTGMVEYMTGGPDNVETVLDDIEASWPS